MPSTERRQRQIDTKLPATGGGAILDGGGAEPAGPGIPTPGAPQQVRILSTTLLYSAVTPQAAATVVWLPPSGAAPDEYVVQWATDASFTAPTSRLAGRGQVSMGLDGLPVNTTVYVRVAARANRVQGAWSDTASATTPEDTTTPDPPTSVNWTWQRTGDLLITWTNATSRNLRDVEIKVWDGAGKGTLYTTAYLAATAYTWSLAENLRATSNSPDAAVYIELRSRSWGGYYSTAAVPSSQPSKAAPATPSGLSVDFAGPDAVFTWTAAADALAWTITIDGTAYPAATAAYTYTYSQNQIQHSGSADPALTYSIVAHDGLGQSSTALTGTATNAAPDPTTISASGAFSVVGFAITASAARDLRDYRVRVYKDAVLVDTIYTRETDLIYAAQSGSGDYTADVTVYDLFGQASTASAQSGAATLEDQAAFAASLRAGARYRDSPGTSADTLKAALADGNRSSGGVSYS